MVMTAAFFLLKPIKTTIEPISPRESTEYWVMDGGYRIAYTHLRPPSEMASTGAPIIFLHGGPGGYIHSSIIEILAPIAASGRDVYLYDQSGTGLSDRRERPKDTTVSTHLRDLESIVQKIGASEVSLIGHSFGGLLAALFASDNPDLVDSLVLSAPAEMEPILFDENGKWLNAEKFPNNGGYEFINTSETYAKDTSMANLPARAIAALVAAQFLNTKLVADSEVDAAMNSMASKFTHNMVCDEKNVQPEEGGGGAYMRIGTNFFPDDFVDRREIMETLSIPVLVLHGQCDFIPYASAYEYADLFPSSEYVFMEGAGHILYWDKPTEYVNRIMTFLDEIE